MDIFLWDNNLETGLAEVDQQHKRLVTVTNEFGLRVSREDLNPEDLEEIFAELVSYTQYHFEEEEKLMAESQVDSRHASQHELEHQNFLRDVTLMHQQMHSALDENARELFQFLMNWLVYHIMGSDMSLARQIVAIQRGQQPQAAFLGEERAVDKATGLLLKSLNNLFQQVTHRNKQLNELNQTLEMKVAERTRALSEANRKLGELALTDGLTGLSNRRHAMQILEHLWEESRQQSLPLASIMLDADGFKAINDAFGHAAGDRVLCELAKQLRHTVRTDDVVCRLGGDEFLIICPRTDLAGALQVARHTHAAISALTVPVPGGVWQGSISVGVAEKTAAMQRPEDLLKIADQYAYAAKDAGKNCVKTAG
jgi:diguanylate cyclase (GGDEF)-like protein/hemerythrin-like metal-binding protein